MESDQEVQVCVIADTTGTGTPSETRRIAVSVTTVDGTAQGKLESSNAVVV